ncbi:MAG: pilus assembly protein TadG-related protein [Kineosporiaceae bacterium]
MSTPAGPGGDGAATPPRTDDGSVLLLTIGYAVVALLLVTVVAGASSVYLQRKQLLAVADAAALDAADAVDRPGYYAALDAGGELAAVPLTDATVGDAAATVVAASPAAARTGARVAPGTGSPDGLSAVVVLTGRARLPVVSPVLDTWSGGIPLVVRAEATAPLGP